MLYEREDGIAPNFKFTNAVVADFNTSGTEDCGSVRTWR